jgi:hypothetical protein
MRASKFQMSFISYCTFVAWVPNYVQAKIVNGVLEGDSACGSNLSLAAPSSNIVVDFALVMSSF